MNFTRSKKFAIFLNSLIFTISFNIPILVQRYMDYKAAGEAAIYSFVGEFFFALAFTYPLLYILTINRVVFNIITYLVYIFSGVSAYFVYKLKITLNEEIIASFFEANKTEITSLISLELILAIFCSFLLGYFLILSASKSKIDSRQNKKINFITAIFVIGCLVGDGDWVKNILPYNIFQTSGKYWLEKASLVKKRLDITKAFNYQLDTKATEDLNIVLIIGESARTDHFQLSGYKRDTNPLLAKENNVIYFKDVTACFPLTRTAVPCMITRATREDRSKLATETSFIGIFKKLGFYSEWYGMQGTYTAIDSPYYDLAKEANKTLLLGTDVDIFSSNDSSLFPFIDQFYEQHSNGKTLLILHTYGSHFHYDERYPNEFKKFNPTCKKKKFLTDMSHCTLEEIINSYDNSILFTDYFVKKVIDKVRNKKALVIYTSDHGESLGENGRFLHGTYNQAEQVEVSMLLWASDKYKESFPENIKLLNSRRNLPILHDHLFHSILGCSGVKSKIIENKLNLCAN